MSIRKVLQSQELFSQVLYDKMKRLNPGVEDMELYEFRYALHNWYPENGGWACVQLDTAEDIVQRVNDPGFYSGIQIKARVADRVILDERIARLTRMLFVGLVSGEYNEEWVKEHFYFDIRGFYFLHRTRYFTERVLAHLGGKPFKAFARKQERFERSQDIGYKEFSEANAELDALFVESVKNLIAVKGTPIVIAIAGPTAAGKTEIVARLREAFDSAGRKVTTIEMDNFCIASVGIGQSLVRG